MRTAKIISSSLSLLWLLVAVAGCTPRSNGADDVADKVGRTLDPDPHYVDPPAPEPQKPQ